jgi:hypothetical protein
LLAAAEVRNPSRFANKPGDAWYSGSPKFPGLYRPYSA